MSKLLSISRFSSALCLCMVFTLGACKKSSGPPAYDSSTNELVASVILSPTQTLPFRFTGEQANLSCSYALGGPVIWGKTEANAMVHIDLTNTSFSCISTPGTYPINFEYRKNTSDNSAPIFSTIGRPKGSLTFTVNDGVNVEGYFSAVSWCQSTGCNPATDSVIATGTFKGKIRK